jgi:hypothetical protein
MGKHKPKRDMEWADAQQRCRLGDEEVRMAKELGLSPRGLIENIPNRSEPWKLPVNLWIQEMYAKMKAKQAKRQAESLPPPVSPLPVEAFDEDEASVPEDIFDDDEVLELPWYENKTGPPDDREIAEQDQFLLRRQNEFRTAAEYVTRALAAFEQVQKVVLFGSVAVPLQKEVPRFARFRRARVEVYHECKDVDLAVWTSSLENLKALQRARARALNLLLRETNIGVAHHQVEIFLMEPNTDRHLGRLCTFGECPKAGKRECLAPDCGKSLFLRQVTGFKMRHDALRTDRTVVLFERITDNGLHHEDLP